MVQGPARFGSKTNQIRTAHPGWAGPKAVAQAGAGVDEVPLPEQARRQHAVEGCDQLPRGAQKRAWIQPGSRRWRPRSQLPPALHEGLRRVSQLGLIVSSLFSLSFPLPLSLLLFTCFLTNIPFYTAEFTRV